MQSILVRPFSWVSKLSWLILKMMLACHFKTQGRCRPVDKVKTLDIRKWNSGRGITEMSGSKWLVMWRWWFSLYMRNDLTWDHHIRSCMSVWESSIDVLWAPDDVPVSCAWCLSTPWPWVAKPLGPVWRETVVTSLSNSKISSMLTQNLMWTFMMMEPSSFVLTSVVIINCRQCNHGDTVWASEKFWLLEHILLDVMANYAMPKLVSQVQVGRSQNQSWIVWTYCIDHNQKRIPPIISELTWRWPGSHTWGCRDDDHDNLVTVLDDAYIPSEFCSQAKHHLKCRSTLNRRLESFDPLLVEFKVGRQLIQLTH